MRIGSYLSTDSGLLQQVLLDLGSLDGSSLVEMDVDVFPETRRVVVADCFSVAKGWRRRSQHSGDTSCWVK